MLLAACTLAGCAPQVYVEQADREVAALVDRAQRRELGYGADFSIDDGPSRNVALTVEQIVGHLPPAPQQPEWLVPPLADGRAQRPAHLLSLPAALRLARRNSSDFQSQKEALYQTALTLTERIHDFEFQYAAGGSADYTLAGEDQNVSLSTGADVAITRMLATGATVALDLGLTGVKYFNGTLGNTLQNAIGLSISQPLWRGADRVVVLADLIQARNNLVYELRDFVRFEKDFSVEVASAYYNTLLQLDRVSNQWSNYQNLIAARKYNELHFKEDRIAAREVDQARQSELQAHNSYLTALQSYQRQLDRYRTTLGLPPDAPVVLDRNELERVVAAGFGSLDVPSEDAVAIALARRLDLKNRLGGVTDANRDVYVAADDLKGDLDIAASADLDTRLPHHAGDVQFHEGTYQIGIDLDLPLERLGERNALRRAMISYDQSVRAYMGLVDSIKQSIRESLRQLKRTEQSYRIAQAGVELAQRRVTSVRIELELGEAITRDLLEAQEDLVDAQNTRSEALVANLVARLEFQRDLELLEVDAEGQIHETDLRQIVRQLHPAPEADDDAGA